MTRTSIRLASVGIALLVAASVLSPAVWVAGTATAAEHSFVVEQGSQCYEVTPLGGSEDVVSFYDYRNIENTGGSDQYTYSSYMPQHLTRNDVSRLFLYDGPNGVSLVVIHNELGGSGGGSAATFRFSGLPGSGSWVVQDDDYADQDDRFSRDRIDWMWYGDRTDGAAFRDIDRGGTEITIYPSFDEQAALYDDYDRTGSTVAWQFLTGSLGSPDAVGLNMNQPVTVRTGHCGPDETPPSAALSADDGVVGHSVTFDARGSSDDRGVAEYRWDFDGNGTVDRVTNDPTTSFVYDEPGTYEATVTVVDGGDNADAATAAVAVDPDDPPSAAFEAGDSPTVGFPVTFDAGESDDDVAVAEYRWDFDGDGEVDRTTGSPTVSRTYEATGSYEVGLTVADSGGNEDTATRTVEVDEDDPPEPGFAVESPDAPVEGRQVVFNASEATDDTAITAYRWEFGDGATASGERAAHTFAGNGTYEVTLEVIDEGGNNATETMAVEVLPPDETPPEADASATPRTVEAGANVTFDASESRDDRSIESYAWDFGDGATAGGETVNHTYGAAGTYDATVTVTDDGGNANATTVTVEVRPGRPPNVSASIPEVVAVGESLAVAASASDGASGVASYEWDFAGNATAGREASHAFEETGTYAVTLTVVDRAGQVATTERRVQVVAPNGSQPIARLTVDGDVVTGESVTFDASESSDDDGIVEYRWDFDGDGEVDRTTEDPTVEHAYEEADAYVPAVTVVDGDGNAAAATALVAVEDRKQAHPGNSGGSGGGSAGGGGTADVGPPPVDVTTERPGPNAAVVDVRNARADETVRADLPETDLAAETGVAFDSVAVDLSSDDAHFAVETARDGDRRVGDGAGSPPADVTLGSLAVEGKYVEAEQVEAVTYEVEVQRSRLDEAGLAPADLNAYVHQPGDDGASAGGAWEQVDVSVAEREETVVLQVETDDFAPIAVGGQRTVTLTDAELAAGEVAADQPVSVTATVANEGAEARELALKLTADGEVVATETVEVPPDETTEVRVSAILPAGTHEVGLDGDWIAGQQVGSVEVADSPAGLSVADVSVNESAIAAGERIAVTATVENAGTRTVEETVALTLFGEQVATRTIEVPGGESREVTFVRAIDATGTVTAKVGDETAAVEVNDRNPGDDGSAAPEVPIPGFGPGVTVVALLAVALLARLRKRS